MTTLDLACCACLPSDALPRLGPFRARGDVRALHHADRLWVFWPAPDELARHLLALPDAILLVQREGLWFRLGESLPFFDVPDSAEATQLPHLLSPAGVVPLEPDPRPPLPFAVTLVRDETYRPARALRLP